MKQIKKGLAVLLSLLMIISVLPMSAFADEEYYDSDASGYCDNFYWTYTKETNTVYINASENNLDGRVEGNSDNAYLPLYPTQEDFENDQNNFGILGPNGECAFEHIIFGKDIRILDWMNLCDYYYPLLKTVTFEEDSKLKIIGDFLFYDCPVESIEIPSTVKTIGEGAFACTKITSIDLKNVEDIQESAFASSLITEVTIPKTVKTIGDCAFADCPELKSVTFPKNIEIEQGAEIFSYDEKLEAVDLGSGITEITENEFTSCKSLKNIEIPSTVEYIRDYAFYCSAIENVKLNEGLHGIGQYSFADFETTKSLNNLVIPSTVFSIGSHAFDGAGLTSLTFANNSQISIIGEFAFHNNPITTLTIPARDITFKDCVFGDCKSLESVTFEETMLDGKPYGVSQIGRAMFENCEDLIEVKFPSTLDYIGQYAFSNAFKTDENSIDLDLSNTNLTQIDKFAFAETSDIKSVVLPESLELLGQSAFISSYVESVDVSKTSLINFGAGIFAYCKSLTEVKLPETAEEISGSMFKGCASLTEIEIPKSVTYIGTYAFNDAAISNLDFPDGLEEIGNYAFSNSKITNVDLSKCNNLYSTGQYAFESTYYLQTVKLPEKNFQTIDKKAFYYSGLIELDAPSLVKIDEYAFEHASRLTTVNLPVGLKTLGMGSFNSCKSLKELYIPYTVTMMYSQTLGGTTSLDKIVYAGESSIQGLGYQSIKNARIYGLAGTRAEQYCSEKNLDFIVINAEDVEIDPNLPIFCGTWSNGSTSSGTWKITLAAKNRLTISGKGDLATACTDDDGTTTTFKKLVIKYGIEAISFDDGITSIPSNFLLDNTNEIAINSLVLPTTLKTIGYKAFYQCDLTTLNLPAKVTTIEESAFYGNKLQTFNANPSLYTIGANAFNGNNLLASIDLGNVGEIGGYAFANTKLTSVVLNENLRTLGNGAFKNIPTLKTIDLSKATKLEKLMSEVFYGTGITSITIPKNITYIGQAAFTNCKSLVMAKFLNKDVEIYTSSSLKAYNAIGFDEDNNQIGTLVINAEFGSTAQNYAIKYGFTYDTTINNYTYFGLINQTSSAYANKPLKWFYVEDDKTLYVIGEGYFNQNILRDADGKEFTKKLDIDNIVVTTGVFQVTAELSVFNPETVIFPEGMSTIGNKTLNNLTRLTEIKIPNSVNTMYADTFKGCTNLKYIEFGKYIPDSACKGLTSLEFVDFGSATSIGRYAFEGCTKLQEIVIPDSVTTIGQYAFNKCTSVQSVSIGSGVTKIEPFAFSKLPLCEKVEMNMASVPALSRNIFNQSGASTKGMEIVLGDNVKSIDLGFFDDVKLSKLVLGNNVGSVTNSQLVSSLKTIEVPNDNSSYYSYNDCLYSNSNVLTFVPKNLDMVEIKEGTTAIGESAFEGSNISTVTIPNSVTAIEKKAFYNAKRLKNVRFSKGLISIGESAFEGCELLKTLNLPSTLETLGKSAFRNCIILASVILPEGLKAIASNCFQNCKSLGGIVIPEAVVSIGSDAFSGCSELKEFYIWNTKLGTNVFGKGGKINVYTMVGSPAYEYCRRWNVPYNAYTDEECFYDECAMKIDILAGYLGFCTDGHGDIEWLTVYENDCDNDGYMIGICEYCSEILEEKHLDAKQHNYIIKTEIAPTVFSRGMTVYECQNCNQRYTVYTDKNGSGEFVETHNVSGKVVIATNKEATDGVSPAKNATIVIDGDTVATTNEKGQFSFDLTTGLYEAEIHYAYGFTRDVYIRVEDKDIEFKKPIAIIGCDFNKDGKIDNDDLTLFQYVVSAQRNDPSYLAFVDMNNDGYINAKDRAYIRECMGLDSTTFDYQNIIIEK